MTAGMPCLHAPLGLTEHNAKCFIVERGEKGNPKEHKIMMCMKVDRDVKTCFHKNWRKPLHDY